MGVIGTFNYPVKSVIDQVKEKRDHPLKGRSRERIQSQFSTLPFSLLCYPISLKLQWA
jgi:hypothetical protein